MRNPYIPKPPKLDRNNPYDLCIVAEYAGLNDPNNPLPNATKKGLSGAHSLAKCGFVKEIIWGNSEKPGPGVKILEQTKLDYLHSLGHLACNTISVVSNNTIQEVAAIHIARPRARRIIILCDGPHARRYRRLVRYFYPDATRYFYPSPTVDVMTFKAKWNENHPSPLQQSAPKWWMANLKYHAAMLAYDYTGQMDKFVEKFGQRTHME